MIPVSTLILTKNEEQHIERCLESVTWSNEIIVIDAESTDKTKEICLKDNSPWSSKIKFISRPWDGFKNQRNFSLDQAKNEWVFVIDADEKCSEPLKNKIISFFKNNKTPSHSAYKVKRVEYFLKKEIQYGIWNPSYQDRFFKKKGVQYTNDIHEYPLFNVPPHDIHEPIYHDPDFEPEKFLYKMNKYTSIEALNRYQNGQRTNIFRIITAFPAMFLKNYFYYSAYKDGIHGVVISILEGISRAVRHIKLWKIEILEKNKVKNTP